MPAQLKFQYSKLNEPLQFDWVSIFRMVERSQKKLKWSRLNPPQIMYPLDLDHIFIMKSVWQINKTLNGYTRTLWTIIVIVLSLEYRKWCRYFSTFIHQCYCKDSNEFLFISIWHLHKGESWAHYTLPRTSIFFHYTVI